MMAFTKAMGGLARRIVSDSGLSSAPNSARTILPLYGIVRAMSSSKLFIGGLAWGTDTEALKEAFSSYGEVTDAKVIVDRDTGRSRGFGFVSFTSDQDAESALQAMDGKELGGRMIRVDYATERGSGFGGGVSRGFGGGYGGGDRRGLDNAETSFGNLGDEDMPGKSREDRWKGL
ncbi:hypothetical protein O6H91_01G102800 [Diphasiastrum complanatum]|uniref:Uncharacterized protein n=1 Tax=Diphasiastrum complanatum TaxID=34168 RepID=A0ACC2EU86_DIPCM|nr:hypothetical protein O6H91_01G102800 [Diphasiastrum complanatum]